jgi:hypothetical protein
MDITRARAFRIDIWGSYHRQTSDLFGVHLLLLAVFHPAAYKQFVRVTSRTCQDIKSRTGKANNGADLQERVTIEDIDALEDEVYRIFKRDAAWRLNKPVRYI